MPSSPSSRTRKGEAYRKPTFKAVGRGAVLDGLADHFPQADAVPNFRFAVTRRNRLLTGLLRLAAGGMGTPQQLFVTQKIRLLPLRFYRSGAVSLSSHFDLSLPRRQLRHPNVGVHILDIGHNLVPGTLSSILNSGLPPSPPMTCW